MKSLGAPSPKIRGNQANAAKTKIPAYREEKASESNRSHARRRSEAASKSEHADAAKQRTNLSEGDGARASRTRWIGSAGCTSARLRVSPPPACFAYGFYTRAGPRHSSVSAGRRRGGGSSAPRGRISTVPLASRRLPTSSRTRPPFSDRRAKPPPTFCSGSQVHVGSPLVAGSQPTETMWPAHDDA